MATVIIGTGFIALLGLVAAGTQANTTAMQNTTAINLANNIHEASLRMTYDELPTLVGTYSPAVDSRLVPASQMGGWSQHVVVRPADENMLSAAAPAGDEWGPEDGPVARVIVVVKLQGREVYRTSWLAAASG